MGAGDLHPCRIGACMRYDAAVLGLGGMGSAVLAHLARRGMHAAGFERFALVHDLGSSSGRTRIIRKAYFEDAAYVPLLERAYELWRELEERSQTALLDLFGVLIAGRPEAAAVAGTAHAAKLHGIAVEHLDSKALRARFPVLAFRDDEVGVFEPEAGVVFPERAIAAHLSVARSEGAHLYDRARVSGFEPIADGVRIDFQDGDAVEASRLAICAGPWSADLLAHVRLPLHVQRNVQYWFEPATQSWSPNALPAFLLERDGLPVPLYAIPDLGDGFKIAFHGLGEITTADRLDRSVHANEVAQMQDALAGLLPGSEAKLIASKVCMYTMTPDANFAIGRDPANERIVIACGFSGHGFKFAPVIGEIVAQMLAGEEPPYDLGFLRLERFTSGR